jgi:sugar lactone lactonase YvrE
VLIDRFNRVWITVSAATRGHSHFTRHEREGFIVLVENGNARIVADGLTWTNEVRVSPDGSHLYVNETFAERTSRFKIKLNGALSDRTEINFPPGSFPDGMAFDVEGHLWVICIVTNRIIRVAPDGSFAVMLEDFNDHTVSKIVDEHRSDRLTREQIIHTTGEKLANQSSIAFGGPDRRTIYMGSLTKDCIMAVPAPVAGEAPIHWDWS